LAIIKNFMNKKIYLDHSATTPVDKKVLEDMKPYFTKIYGNPSSIHNFGQAALAGADKAREQAANFFNCETGEIIFTSGATESDNLTITGVVKKIMQTGFKNPHIIASLVEHDAILEPCAELEKEGVEVSYLQVKKDGVIDLEKFKKLIKDNTVLASIMWVNSEIGAIMPIREAGKIIKKINEKRQRDWKKLRPKDRGERPQKIYFHTDATQALNFINCDVKWNYIDLLSMSAHKIYGPKGVGVLYKKEGVPLAPLQTGGHHENNYRSGTLNISGIVGLGSAIERLGKSGKGLQATAVQNKTNAHIGRLRDMLVRGIVKNIPDTILNTDRKKSVSSHAHFSFLGVEGESILIALDLKGIAVSTGSACASGNLKASHVLLAMGIKKEIAHNSIRFTLGKHNREEEIGSVIKILPPIIKKLRKMNPLYKGEQ